MHSKALRQRLLLTLDSMGARGPVTRRGVAEEVVKMTAFNGRFWSLADEHAARLIYIQSEVTRAMRAPHSEHVVAQYFGQVPQEYRAALFGLPRFICISPGGGHGAQHVMSLLATPDEWEANSTLKDRVVELSQISADESRSIRRLLQYTKRQTLSELLGVDQQALTRAETADVE